MAAINLNQLNFFCELFNYFAEIDGDKMLAHIFMVLSNNTTFHIKTVRLI